jgi:Tfp pilus assembly protein PilF
LLGALELQRKNNEAAVRLIRQALKLNPQSAAVHFNVGVALRQLERYEEALDSFDRAIHSIMSVSLIGWLTLGSSICGTS